MEDTTPAKKSPSAAPAQSSMSLEGLHGSVAAPDNKASFWKKWRSFVGPGLMISVGYMDPGNWGTDLQGGAEYKYGLLWVVAMASLMAIFLQITSARLGVATGKDLAQACRDWYPKWTRWPNWLLCEAAIGACDLAEVLGSAVAINLMFKIPLFWAVVITSVDVLLLLALEGYGMRMIEAVISVLVGTIAVCFFIEIFVIPELQPSIVELGSGLVPKIHDAGMIYVAIGIIGATVMPHNLYLHSALVQSRQLQKDDESIRTAIKFNTLDSAVSLTIAFFVNAAILVLAGMVFYGKTSLPGPDGQSIPITEETDWIKVAYLTLAPLMGAGLASILFGVALLASGQSSTVTGTLAGQVVMEGFMRWRIAPWFRRIITRSMAVLPAIVIIGIRGDDSGVTAMLTLSQVILALQLPFAIFPLLHFASSKKYMGKWALGWFLKTACWTSALVILAMDIYGLPESLKRAWAVITGH